MARAEVVDANIPSVTTGDTTRNILWWNTCGGIENRKGMNANCSIDFTYGMKRDFNAWLASLGAAAPFKTLTDLRFFNLSHANDVPRSAIKFGQSLLDISDEMDLAADKAKYTTDRAKDVIITGGENVSSIEVEDCLYQHPGVAEVAVIGVPDEKWGELVMALVVTTPGSALTEADVIAHTKAKLAGYKCPKRVEFREALARTATGKLQKFKLRAEFWEGEGTSIKG